MTRQEELNYTFWPMLRNLEDIKGSPKDYLAGSLGSIEEWIENLKQHHKVTEEEWEEVCQPLHQI